MNNNIVSDISYMIGEYQRWKKEISRLQRAMYGTTITMHSWGVAQYGIEAVMPKGSSIRSAKELERMDIRERKQYLRLERLEAYVYALEYAFEILKDEELIIIYDCLLDGMTYRQIAAHLLTSKDYIYRKKKDIVRQIGQDRQIQTILTFEKSAV